MASPLQNRIVGTVIIVALAVIILPDLLDGNKVQRQEELQTIPLRPELTSQQQRAQFPQDFDERLEAAEPVTRSLQPDDAPATSSQPEQFEAPAEPVTATVEGGWVVRLGAFRNADTVTRLVSQLQDAGYRAYSRSVQSEAGELSVLLVGPDLNEEALRSQLPELQELTGLDGQIERYQPVPD